MKSGVSIDEKILRLRGYYRNCTKSYDLLTDEFSIRGKRVRFAPFSLFEGRVSALIPDNFIIMPETIARVRYISSYRPPVILTNKRFDENIAFHLLRWEDAGENAGLDVLIQQMQDTVRLHAPETVIYDMGSITAEEAQYMGEPGGTDSLGAFAGPDGRWFEYKNFTLDEETYNLQFLIHSDIYLLAGTFNCRMVFYDEWKTLILKSLEYIKTQRKGKQADESR